MKNFTFRKRLLALALCAFAWIGTNAAITASYDESTSTLTINSEAERELETLLKKAIDHSDQLTSEENLTLSIINNNLTRGTILKLTGTYESNDINSTLSTKLGDDEHCTIDTYDFSEAYFPNSLNAINTKSKDKIIKITFPSSHGETTIPEVAGFDQLAEIVLPTSITEIPDNAFQGCINLSEVNIQECQNLISIGDNAFERTGLVELDLTGMPNLKTIGDEAFKNITTLEIVRFDTTLESLGQEVFRESKSITDVYVNFVEGTDGKITCPKGCFDYDTTVKQTAEEGDWNAQLHYPEQFYSFYVHDGLRPVFYKQDDLNTLKDDATKAVNGWQEFISSGIPFEEGAMLSTFSSQTPQRCPIYQTGGTNQDVYVYIVSGYSEGKTTLVELDKKTATDDQGTYYYYLIPRNTGVILYSKTVGMIVMAPDVNNSDRPHNQWDGHDKLNYLEPFCGDSPTNILPANKEGNTITFRNFSLCKLSETSLWGKDGYTDDYWGFFRLMKCTVPAKTNKAYLHFPASVYSDGAGDVADNDAQWRTYGLEAKGIQLFFETDSFFDESETTGISQISTERKQMSLGTFTLQGIRVNKAHQPGLYIVNGKKVIVK